MKLKVIRDTFDQVCTLGKLYIDGVYFCETLEDVVRGNGDAATVAQWKIKNESAIPYGTYNVIIDFSQHFQKIMLHILNTPGFTGARFHGGNDADDTDGCVLVGSFREEDEIHDSASARLQALVQAALDRKEKVTVEICSQ